MKYSQNFRMFDTLLNIVRITKDFRKTNCSSEFICLEFFYSSPAAIILNFILVLLLFHWEIGNRNYISTVCALAHLYLRCLGDTAHSKSKQPR